MKTRLLAVWVLFSSVAAFAGENATTTAPFGRGLIAIDLGGTVDFGRNQLFELSLSGNTATWSNSDPGVMDQALNPLVGVAGGSCDEAFLLGASPFRVSR